MNNDTFEILSSDALKALSDHRLGDALNAMKGMQSYIDDAPVADELNTVSENYSMMLSYMAKGFSDTERVQLFRGFLRKSYELCSRMSRSFELRENRSHYTATWETLQRMDVPKTLPDIATSQCSYRVLFDVVWTSPVWREEDAEAARTLLEGDALSVEKKCLLLSAAMLGALYFFDVAKLKFLLSALLRTELPLRARALVGAVFVMVKWEKPCSLYGELADQWRVMSDAPGFVTDLTGLQAQLLLSLETKKIENKVRDEILPEVLKNSRRFNLRKKNLNIDELKDEFAKLSTNPEWEGKNSRLSDKMKELIDMQQKGADVFIGSFKMFKQNFPFFTVAANWFCPFTLTHPDLPQDIRRNAFINMLTASDHLCESDKYSFSLMLAQMQASQSQNKEMLDQQMSQIFGGEMPQTDSTTPKTVQSYIRSYVLDLYRFFKLYRFREERTDPFKCNLLLIDHVPFGEIISSYSSLQDIADFTFGIASYPWALKFYKLLPPNAEVLQKIGYCYQVEKDYPHAIEAYSQANLFKSDSVWTLRQLARCHRQMGEPEKALKCYEELERLSPDNTDDLLRAGECHVVMADYPSALQKFYKAYYLSSENLVAMRAIAWCCLQEGQDEQAETYYQKVLDKQPEADDYLNAGHAAWVSGNVQTAVQRYLEYLRHKHTDIVTDHIFDDDLEFLKSRGLTSDDIHIMSDILKQQML